MTVRMANGVNDNSVVCREKNREYRVLTTMYEALGRWCMWDFAGAQSGLEVNACCILEDEEIDDNQTSLFQSSLD